MKKPTTTLFFDNRIQKKDNTYPVKLTIYYNGQKKRYGLGVDLTENEWKKINGERLRDERLNEIKKELNVFLKKANDILDKLPFFSFSEFESQFFAKPFNVDNFFDSAQKKIDDIIETRPSTASILQNCLASFKSHLKKNVLLFNEITPEFLKKHEDWMVKNSKSLATVGIYLREVRKLFNEYIDINPEMSRIYPFGKGSKKYQIPTAKNVKIAIDIDDIEKIFNFNSLKNETEEYSRNIWMFSYLCNGINIADVARLKYKCIENGSINFVRKKTRNSTKSKSILISVPLSKEMDEIINKYGTSPKLSDNYIFPILINGLTEREELKKVKQETKTVNKYIKRISQSVGIEANVTSMTARHSFATILKRSGAPTSYIGDTFGHSDVKTTQNYLGDYSFEEKKKWQKELTKFKTKKKKSKNDTGAIL